MERYSGQYSDVVRIYNSVEKGRGLVCASNNVQKDQFKTFIFSEEEKCEGVSPGTVIFSEPALFIAPINNDQYRRSYERKQLTNYSLHLVPKHQKTSSDEISIPACVADKIESYLKYPLRSKKENKSLRIGEEECKWIHKKLRLAVLEHFEISLENLVKNDQSKRKKKGKTTNDLINGTLFENLAFAQQIEKNMINVLLMGLSLGMKKETVLLLIRCIQTVESSHNKKTFLKKERKSSKKEKKNTGKNRKNYMKQLVLELGTSGNGCSYRYSFVSRQVRSFLYYSLPISVRKSWTLDDFMCLAENVDAQISVLSEFPHGEETWSIYPLCSLIEHSCRPNVYFVMRSDGKMQCRAIDFIGKGEPLRYNYAQDYTYHGVFERHDYLYKHYMFICKCDYCTVTSLPLENYRIPKDQTRGFWCMFCKNGILLPFTEYTRSEKFVWLARDTDSGKHHIPFSKQVVLTNDFRYEQKAFSKQEIWQCEKCKYRAPTCVTQQIYAEELYMFLLVYGNGDNKFFDNMPKSAPDKLVKKQDVVDFYNNLTSHKIERVQYHSYEGITRKEFSISDYTAWSQRKVMHPSHHLIAYYLSRTIVQESTKINMDVMSLWDHDLTECQNHLMSQFDPHRINPLEGLVIGFMSTGQFFRAYDTLILIFMISKHALGTDHPNTIEVKRRAESIIQMIADNENGCSVQKMGNAMYEKVMATGKVSKIIDWIEQFDSPFPNMPKEPVYIFKD